MFSTQGYGSDAKSTCSIRTERKAHTPLYFLVHFMFRVQIIRTRGNGFGSPPLTEFILILSVAVYLFTFEAAIFL